MDTTKTAPAHHYRGLEIVRPIVRDRMGQPKQSTTLWGIKATAVDHHIGGSTLPRVKAMIDEFLDGGMMQPRWVMPGEWAWVEIINGELVGKRGSEKPCEAC